MQPHSIGRLSLLLSFLFFLPLLAFFCVCYCYVFPPADQMPVVSGYVILCLSLWRIMCAKMWTIWIPKDLELFAKVVSRWQFVIVITAAESLLFVPQSSKCGIAEVSVWRPRIVSAPKLTCSSFVFTREFSMSVGCRIGLDRALGVNLGKNPFLYSCSALFSICYTLLNILNIAGVTRC